MYGSHSGEAHPAARPSRRSLFPAFIPAPIPIKPPQLVNRDRAALYAFHPHLNGSARLRVDNDQHGISRGMKKRTLTPPTKTAKETAYPV